MNTRTLSIIAIGLWFVSALLIATMFVKGTTGPGSDGRTSIYINQTEKDHILQEMRSFLHSIQVVLAGVHSSDLSQARKLALISGAREIESVSPVLMAKLPIQFKQWGRAVHSDFDGLARAIAVGEGREQLLGRVVAQLKGCIECHETYRLDLEQAN